VAHISLKNITKRYDKVAALDNVSLEVNDKEFLVLFGPAGAGKTTTLKMIAGLEFPDEGLIRIKDEIVNVVPPANRNVSMVFENYALYPHLSVYDNIASPMRSSLYKESEEYIKEAVHRVTKIMKIDQLLDRLPSQLSNGQRQRVALGRCLVRKPNVFLMDEPLAHLDAKLRHFMRAELKEMQASFNTTTIYVTHDYMEALSLGDRIAIINHGKIVQIGTGSELFYTPADEFVARLMGEPEINLIDGAVSEERGKWNLRLLGRKEPVTLPGDIAERLAEKNVSDVHVGVRGNDIEYSLEPKGDGWFKGSVYVLEPIGNRSILTVIVEGVKIRIIAPNDFKSEMDQDIYINFHIADAIFFEQATGKFIVRHKQEELLREESKCLN